MASINSRKNGSRKTPISVKPIAEEINNISSSTGKIIQNNINKEQCFKNDTGILENTKNRNIPIGLKLKKEIKKSQPLDYKLSKSVKSCKENKIPVYLPESSEKIYGKPELHSTLRIAKLLQKIQDEDPNVTLMVDAKLNSPSTSNRVKKKVSYL